MQIERRLTLLRGDEVELWRRRVRNGERRRAVRKLLTGQDSEFRIQIGSCPQRACLPGICSEFELDNICSRNFRPRYS